MNEPSELPTVIAPARYVLLPLANLVTGHTVKAMERKIERGDLARGARVAARPRWPGDDRSAGLPPMGRRSISGGVAPKGADRIEFTFFYQGKRYRPTLMRAPTAANLRRARLQLEAIKARIKAGTFSFLEEFPDYRFLHELDEVKSEQAKQLTCNDVFDAFIAHCEMRVAMNDMAYSTLDGYRDILDAVWRPKIGADPFEEIVYSRLAGIVARHTQNKKTYNNIVSVVRCAFSFGYKDHPEKHNPASGLNTLRITKKDRPPIDPFTIQEGELIIAESHAEFGPAHW